LTQSGDFPEVFTTDFADSSGGLTVMIEHESFLAELAGQTKVFLEGGDESPFFTL
jgi:hypothetical protein